MIDERPAPDLLAPDTSEAGRAAGSRWDEIRERLETSRAVLDSRFEPSAEEKSRILRDRAQELAREAREEAGTRLDVVEFRLAHETYGIEPEFIREIFPLKTLTPIPCTPPFVLGVTNVRGEILSVLDLKRFFDLPEKGLTDFTKVIVLHSAAMTFGILADSVVGTRSIPVDEIQPAFSTLTDLREEYLKGVTTDRMAILDGERVLSDEAIVVHQKV